MLLTKALPYHPFLVKPNLEELEEIVGKKLDGLSAIEIAAQQMQQLGARNVLVSLGGEGALLIDEKAMLITTGPQREKSSIQLVPVTVWSQVFSQGTKRPVIMQRLSIGASALAVPRPLQCI